MTPKAWSIKNKLVKLNLIQVKKNFFSSKYIIKKMKRHDTDMLQENI